jgi:hypothetical protein
MDATEIPTDTDDGLDMRGVAATAELQIDHRYAGQQEVLA